MQPTFQRFLSPSVVHLLMWPFQSRVPRNRQAKTMIWSAIQLLFCFYSPRMGYLVWQPIKLKKFEQSN